MSLSTSELRTILVKHFENDDFRRLIQKYCDVVNESEIICYDPVVLDSRQSFHDFRTSKNNLHDNKIFIIPERSYISNVKRDEIKRKKASTINNTSSSSSAPNSLTLSSFGNKKETNTSSLSSSSHFTIQSHDNATSLMNFVTKLLQKIFDVMEDEKWNPFEETDDNKYVYKTFESPSSKDYCSSEHEVSMMLYMQREWFKRRRYINASIVDLICSPFDSENEPNGIIDRLPLLHSSVNEMQFLQKLPFVQLLAIDVDSQTETTRGFIMQSCKHSLRDEMLDIIHSAQNNNGKHNDNEHTTYYPTESPLFGVQNMVKKVLIAMEKIHHMNVAHMDVKFRNIAVGGDFYCFGNSSQPNIFVPSLVYSTPLPNGDVGDYESSNSSLKNMQEIKSINYNRRLIFDRDYDNRHSQNTIKFIDFESALVQLNRVDALDCDDIRIETDLSDSKEGAFGRLGLSRPTLSNALTTIGFKCLNSTIHGHKTNKSVDPFEYDRFSVGVVCYHMIFLLQSSCKISNISSILTCYGGHESLLNDPSMALLPHDEYRENAKDIFSPLSLFTKILERLTHNDINIGEKNVLEQVLQNSEPSKASVNTLTDITATKNVVNNIDGIYGISPFLDDKTKCLQCRKFFRKNGSIDTTLEPKEFAKFSESFNDIETEVNDNLYNENYIDILLFKTYFKKTNSFVRHQIKKTTLSAMDRINDNDNVCHGCQIIEIYYTTYLKEFNDDYQEDKLNDFVASMNVDRGYDIGERMELGGNENIDSIVKHSPSSPSSSNMSTKNIKEMMQVEYESIKQTVGEDKVVDLQSIVDSPLNKDLSENDGSLPPLSTMIQHADDNPLQNSLRPDLMDPTMRSDNFHPLCEILLFANSLHLYGINPCDYMFGIVDKDSLWNMLDRSNVSVWYEKNDGNRSNNNNNIAVKVFEKKIQSILRCLKRVALIQLREPLSYLSLIIGLKTRKEFENIIIFDKIIRSCQSTMDAMKDMDNFEIGEILDEYLKSIHSFKTQWFSKNNFLSWSMSSDEMIKYFSSRNMMSYLSVIRSYCREVEFFISRFNYSVENNPFEMPSEDEQNVLLRSIERNETSKIWISSNNRIIEVLSRLLLPSSRSTLPISISLLDPYDHYSICKNMSALQSEDVSKFNDSFDRYLGVDPSDDALENSFSCLPLLTRMKNNGFIDMAYLMYSFNTGYPDKEYNANVINDILSKLLKSIQFTHGDCQKKELKEMSKKYHSVSFFPSILRSLCEESRIQLKHSDTSMANKNTNIISAKRTTSIIPAKGPKTSYNADSSKKRSVIDKHLLLNALMDRKGHFESLVEELCHENDSHDNIISKLVNRAKSLQDGELSSLFRTFDAAYNESEHNQHINLEGSYLREHGINTSIIAGMILTKQFLLQHFEHDETLTSQTLNKSLSSYDKNDFKRSLIAFNCFKYSLIFHICLKNASLSTHSYDRDDNIVRRVRCTMFYMLHSYNAVENVSANWNIKCDEIFEKLVQCSSVTHFIVPLRSEVDEYDASSKSQYDLFAQITNTFKHFLTNRQSREDVDFDTLIRSKKYKNVKNNKATHQTNECIMDDSYWETSCSSKGINILFSSFEKKQRHSSKNSNHHRNHKGKENDENDVKSFVATESSLMDVDERQSEDDDYSSSFDEEEEEDEDLSTDGDLYEDDDDSWYEDDDCSNEENTDSSQMDITDNELSSSYDNDEEEDTIIAAKPKTYKETSKSENETDNTSAAATKIASNVTFDDVVKYVVHYNSLFKMNNTHVIPIVLFTRSMPNILKHLINSCDDLPLLSIQERYDLSCKRMNILNEILCKLALQSPLIDHMTILVIASFATSLIHFGRSKINQRAYRTNLHKYNKFMSSSPRTDKNAGTNFITMNSVEEEGNTAIRTLTCAEEEVSLFNMKNIDSLVSNLRSFMYKVVGIHNNNSNNTKPLENEVNLHHHHEQQGKKTSGIGLEKDVHYELMRLLRFKLSAESIVDHVEQELRMDAQGNISRMFETIRDSIYSL